MLRRNKDNQLITKKDLDKTLEKALSKQSNVILEAVDFGFKKVNKEIEVLKTDVSVLKTDVSVLKTDVSVLKTDVSELKETTGKILSREDKIFKQLDDLKQEEKMNTGLYKRHDEKLENHEQRISGLETTVKLAKLNK